MVIFSQLINGVQAVDHKMRRDLLLQVKCFQLLSFSAIFSILIAVMVLIGNEGMLRLMFGKVEDSVMHSCITYLRISAYSYPALAVYNAGAALFRSIGKTSVTMYLSVISNIINVVGNLIGVFVLRAGVAGVAYPSLIARTFSAVMITVLCFQRKNEVFYRCKWIFRWNVDFMKQILKIAIPNGMENGIFQLVKVALSGIVALFGTYQIAANGVAQSIEIDKNHIADFICMVSFDFSSDSILYEILCFAAGDQTACNLAGFNP